MTNPLHTPAEIVQAQLDAYNARDAARFVACYANDVVVAELSSGQIRYEGIDAFREGYAAQFTRWPNQRVRLMQRQIAGDIVLDTEFVTGVPDRPDTHVVAIYRVREGLIDRVWFSSRF